MAVDLLPGFSPEKPWQPEKWNPRHTMVVLLHLSGSTNKEIEEHTGYSYGKVSQILNDPRAAVIVQQHLGQMNEAIFDVGLRMKMLAHEALDEIVDEMRSDPKSAVRQKAAFGILDRAGYTPVHKNMQLNEGTDSSMVGSVADRVRTAIREMDSGKEIIYDMKSAEEEDDSEAA